MPQLDKYIFLQQILTLIFVFFLIYKHLRGRFIPYINGVLKYKYKILFKYRSQYWFTWFVTIRSRYFKYKKEVRRLNIYDNKIILIIQKIKKDSKKNIKRILNFDSFLCSTKINSFYILSEHNNLKNKHLYYTLDNFNIEEKNFSYSIESNRFNF